MSKLCVICGEQNEFSINKFCRKCYYEEVKIDKYKEEHKKFKAEILSNVKKNTKRAFPKEMKEEVMKRDNGCIICGDQNTMELHHAKYGASSEYGPERNSAKSIVWLCKDCHYDIHSMGNRDKRMYCIKYLEKLG